MLENITKIFLVSLAVSACAPSASHPVSQNEVVTDVARDGQTIVGRYDPSGFTSAQVQTMVNSTCIRPGLSDFVETSENGQITFTTRCANGNKYGASSGTNFARNGANTATFSSIFSNNGQIATTSGEVRI